MKVIVKKDDHGISIEASKIIAEEIGNNPKAILGLATGSTPIGTYKELIKMHKEEGLDFSNITTFNLDEYVGLDGGNPNSYRYFMNTELFDQININKNNTFVPDGKALNIEEHCKEYDNKIEGAGGIDIQVLGIGENGHIAFNEPDEALSIGTCKVDLTPETIETNSRFFDSIDEVPKTAITMGIGSIMKAKKIILLANGVKKAEVIKNILKDGKISTKVPASLLLLHPDVTFIVDEDAYSLSN